MAEATSPISEDIMTTIDTQILRNAADIALAGRTSGTLNSIAHVVAVLAPSPDGKPFVTAEDLKRAGIPIQTMPSGHPRALADHGDRPRFSPDREEALQIAFRYALANTKGAPQPDWANFNLVCNALQLFDRAAAPEAKVRHPAKKIRAAILRHPLWHYEEHRPTWHEVVWRRDKRDASGQIVTLQQDYDEVTLMEECSAGTEGAISSEIIRHGETVGYLRPTSTQEWPRIMTVELPSGDRREIQGVASLVSALHQIQGFVTAVVENGTRVRVHRVQDGIEDFTAVYHARDGLWRDTNGDHLPVVRRDRFPWTIEPR